jgi:DNA-binding transcriptional LysR family regulator
MRSVVIVVAPPFLDPFDSVSHRQDRTHARYVVRSNSVLALVSNAKAGVGVVALPIALGDAEPDSVRVLGPIPELTHAWRVLVHPDVRHRPRVAASFDFAAPETDALGPILIG